MTLTVQLDWKPNAQFAGLLIAQHRGWFVERGLDVDILPWRPATDPIANVAAQVGLIAVSEDNLAIQAAAAGSSIKVLGAMLQRSPLAWMVLEDSPIADIAGFAGKRIGVHVDGVTGLQFAMKTAGLELSAADVVDVPYDKMDQLADGRLDVCQCNGLVEPIEMRASGIPVRVMWGWDVGYSVYSQVLSTSDDTLAAHRGEVDAFMEVLWRGWHAVYESTTGAAEIIVDEFLHETDAEVQHAILEVMRPFVYGTGMGADEPTELGTIDPVRLQSSVDLLVANGVLDQPFDAARLIRASA